MTLIEWFPTIALFVVALAVGSQSGKLSFRPFAIIMIICLLGIFYNWQYKHGFPGVLVPAFAAELGRWVVGMVVGLMIGGLALSKDMKNS